MRYIDIHAHLNFEIFKKDIDAVIKKINDKDIAVINVGTKYETSLEAVRLAQQNENMYAIIGLHPIHVNPCFHDQDEIGYETKPFTSKGEDFDSVRFSKLLEHNKIVAIGECGLDYFHIDKNVVDFKERQKKAFIDQIDFALKYDFPIMIHCRDAYDDVLKILKEYKNKLLKEGGEDLAKKLRGDVHFFAGTKKDALEFLELGFDISFTGVITFADSYRELIEIVPIDRIHAETDSPYVAPAPFRGQRNDPSHVLEVVKKISEIKKIPIEKLHSQLISNANRLFNIKL